MGPRKPEGLQEIGRGQPGAVLDRGSYDFHALPGMALEAWREATADSYRRQNQQACQDKQSQA